jgi:hypothetical protein
MTNSNNKKKITKITVEQLECNRCFYAWWPRITRDGRTVIPQVCPNSKCKSRYWNKERVFASRGTFAEGKIHDRPSNKKK